MIASTAVSTDPLNSPIVRDLSAMSVIGLRKMFISERGVFCQRLIDTRSGVAAEGLSPRYTTMTLLGLRRYQECGHASGFSLVDLTVGLVRETDWLEGIGDLGLLLWACAEIAPGFLSDCCQHIDPSSWRGSWPVCRERLWPTAVSDRFWRELLVRHANF
jgi:hypothetical protein